MNEIRVEQSDEFKLWLSKLRDMVARAAILTRINRLRLGNSGDSESVGEGVSELRVDVGKGYRVYYTRIGLQLVLLLIGGDKSSQDRDIKKAKSLNFVLREEIERSKDDE